MSASQAWIFTRPPVDRGHSLYAHKDSSPVQIIFFFFFALVSLNVSHSGSVNLTLCNVRASCHCPLQTQRAPNITVLRWPASEINKHGTTSYLATAMVRGLSCHRKTGKHFIYCSGVDEVTTGLLNGSNTSLPDWCICSFFSVTPDNEIFQKCYVYHE